MMSLTAQWFQAKAVTALTKKFASEDLKGGLSSIHHLAARAGTEDINQAYIDALPPAATLP
jgi:predicted transcriptional regulator